jgi:hypothetical protein
MNGKAPRNYTGSSESSRPSPAPSDGRRLHRECNRSGLRGVAHRACETRIHCCGCKAESDDAFTARMFEALKRSNARDREGNERKAKKPGRPEDKKRNTAIMNMLGRGMSTAFKPTELIGELGRCHARRPFPLTTKLCMRSPKRARFLLDPVAHAGPERQGHNATGDRRGLAPFGREHIRSPD